MAAAVLAGGAGSHAEVMWSGIVNLNIPSTTNGLYLNASTGAYNVDGGNGSTVPGWDVNPWSSSTLNFFNPSNPTGGVYVRDASTASGVSNLAFGTMIGDMSTYSAGGVQTTGDFAFNLNSSENLVGFRFFDEDAGTIHYGWMRIELVGTLNGQPRTLVEYAYESTPGASIAAGVVPSDPCPADIDGNGLVNAGDLGKLLSEWGNPCCGSDIDGDGQIDAADIAALLSDWGATCGPVIDSIDPASGSSAGGSEVTISGRHLAAATSVSFGGAEAEIVSASGDAIVVLTPPGEIGVRDLSITTPFGSIIDAGVFEYLSPVPWATILESAPDPKVVTDPDLLAAIIATGLPWRVRDNASQIEMLLVPPGTFMMGCSPSLQYACGGDEFPVHEVSLTLAFYLGRFEVTQAQWTAVMGSNPSYFAGYADSSSRPVERVSWNMAQAFEAATGLRLPSEAEREFACRAGTTSAISNGSNDEGSLAEVAWYNQSAGGQSRVVGLKPPNRLGFHDMHGNVWEWVEDWYAGDYYSVSPLVDPSGPPNGSSKVRRGGSWNSPAFNCLTSKRNATSPDSQFFQTGLRVARSP